MRPHRTAATALAALLLGLAMLPLSGCERRGPAERAGAKIDRAGEKLRDTVDPPQGPAEKVGRSLDRATGR
jgi:hypothetical protein